MASIDVRLKRVDRIYRPGETVEGVVVVRSKGSLSHTGIQLFAEGVVTMQLSAKSVGLFEAFYNSLKPVDLLKTQIEVASAGKLPAGTVELPFAFELEPVRNQKLYETYHGVFINIQYVLRVECTRSMLSKNLANTIEFIVEIPAGGVKNSAPLEFTITPSSLKNVKKSALASVPSFCIRGRLDSGYCPINRPFTGSLVVEEADAVIKSIELQLVRVETCGCADGYAKEATEIQNIQIAEGDVCRELEIPIYMIFPRLFSCPTIATRNFKIEFEMNLVVLLADGHLITENFPIRIVRPEEGEQTDTSWIE